MLPLPKYYVIILPPYLIYKRFIFKFEFGYKTVNEIYKPKQYLFMLPPDLIYKNFKRNILKCAIFR